MANPVTPTPPRPVNTSPAAAPAADPAAPVPPQPNIPPASAPAPAIGDFLRTIFGNENSGPRWGAIAGTAATAGIGMFITGSFMGGGFLATLIGGALGGGLGLLFGNTFNNWWERNVSGPQSRYLAQEALPNPRAVNVTDITINRPGQAPYEGELIAPDLRHFNFNQLKEIAGSGRNLGATVRERFEALDRINNPDELRREIDRFYGPQGEISQFLANAQLWNARATEWNQPGGHRERLIEAYGTARTGLGLPPGQPPIAEAPVTEINVTIPPNLLDYGITRMRNYTADDRPVAKANESITPADRAQWQADPGKARIQDQLLYIEQNLQAEIDRLHPRGIAIGTAGFNIETAWAGQNRGWVQFGTTTSMNIATTVGNTLGMMPNAPDGLPMSEIDLFGAGRLPIHRRADAAYLLHCQLTSRFMQGNRLNRRRLEIVSETVQQGLAWCDRERNTQACQDARKEFLKAQRYVELLCLRDDARNTREALCQRIEAFSTASEQSFPEFIRQGEQLQAQVQQMNRQIEIQATQQSPHGVAPAATAISPAASNAQTPVIPAAIAGAAAVVATAPAPAAANPTPPPASAIPRPEVRIGGQFFNGAFSNGGHQYSYMVLQDTAQPNQVVIVIGRPSSDDIVTHIARVDRTTWTATGNGSRRGEFVHDIFTTNRGRLSGTVTTNPSLFIMPPDNESHIRWKNAVSELIRDNEPRPTTTSQAPAPNLVSDAFATLVNHTGINRLPMADVAANLFTSPATPARPDTQANGRPNPLVQPTGNTDRIA